MQGISEYYFYILQLYYIHWLALVIFWWYLKGFLCRGSRHLQTVRILLLFQSGFLSFLLLLWLLWLGLPKLCWIVVMRVGNLVLFLILEEIACTTFVWFLWKTYIFKANIRWSLEKALAVTVPWLLFNMDSYCIILQLKVKFFPLQLHL